MSNNISFKNYTGSIASHKAELLVCGLFEGEKIVTAWAITSSYQVAGQKFSSKRLIKSNRVYFVVMFVVENRMLLIFLRLIF